jgi:hypothetical protein
MDRPIGAQGTIAQSAPCLHRLRIGERAGDAERPDVILEFRLGQPFRPRRRESAPALRRRPVLARAAVDRQRNVGRHISPRADSSGHIALRQKLLIGGHNRCARDRQMFGKNARGGQPRSRRQCTGKDRGADLTVDLSEDGGTAIALHLPQRKARQGHGGRPATLQSGLYESHRLVLSDEPH